MTKVYSKTMVDKSFVMALKKPVSLICINQFSECIKHCFNRVLKSLTSALLNIKHLETFRLITKLLNWQSACSVDFCLNTCTCYWD